MVISGPPFPFRLEIPGIAPTRRSHMAISCDPNADQSSQIKLSCTGTMSKPTKEGPLSFELFEPPVTSVSAVSRVPPVSGLSRYDAFDLRKVFLLFLCWLFRQTPFFAEFVSSDDRDSHSDVKSSSSLNCAVRPTHEASVRELNKVSDMLIILTFVRGGWGRTF
jgi:hypothetical protein